MVIRTFASLLAVAGVVAGCGASGTETSASKQPSAVSTAANTAAPAWTMQGPGAAAMPPPAASVPTGSPSTPSASIVQQSLPTIPNGARFTIFCDSFAGPDHQAFSTNVKNLLQANTKLRDWYVVHQATQSILYHGYYAEIDAKSAGKDVALRREAERAQRDHQLLETIPSPTSPDRKMFPRSLFVPLDAPDPDAPPAWNLTNAPGFWTVQVAAFTGPERKQAAVESVRSARAMNVPAFYYHGENISSVCVGSWDRSAVKEQSTAQPGSVDFDRGARDESEMVINYSGQPLDAADPITKRIGPDGRPIRVLQAKAEILDQSMIATLRAYPEHAVDSRVQMIEASDKRDGQKRMIPRPSFVVQIPRARSVVATTAEPDAAPANPNAARQDLGARLKGLGR